MQFSWPYPDPETIDGYWGKPTALIDWCEENYVVTPYIAEWCNTITNAAFLVVAFYCTYSAYTNKLEKRFIFIGLGFSLVGIGSWLFHMTLQYRFQLLDELPMLYATVIPSWSIFVENQENLIKNVDERKAKSLRIQFIYSALLFGFVSILTWLYIVVRVVEIFQILYGVLTVMVVIASGILTYRDVHDPVAKRNLFTTMCLGIVPFVLGFICWQLDIHLCSLWIHIRRTYLELPLGILLELHGWWHLLTGTGVYIYVVYLQYLRVMTQGRGDDYIFIYRWSFFPELVKKGLTVRTPYSLEFWGPRADVKATKKE
ncbi:uncharacterized protein GVI51_H05445 [Nakaseomyces glabratus]|uniref:Alkaline ceramidase YDC1 n=2 Tax=Candida glabrata TaxID=5478 RepID=Q6FRV5_CANGA|nr:uncharacterized protein CAGL0H05599g [Nakaseomyces glabratus]KAH7586229.1 Ceramidase [Nakaseomyces glabratus]KAH7588388.1 Ceramidase [Nakaseomyces glabratus]KAH7592201.1 Ceramidase [Nakaseomyces glabratus]KAH7600846.1 Ceramidase [Nakaseomyces glabratus]KAH7601466.1 Ceramidase [Nakaseomyces glabratus]|eukprot:XP_447039.1 uncharacterized protein CAGL0H05599g [[Candida] glabrata]